MTDVQEVFGLSEANGTVKILLSEGMHTVLFQMGHTVQHVGPKSARVLARRLNELALRIEKRQAKAAIIPAKPPAKK